MTVTPAPRPSIMRHGPFAAFFVAASISNAAGWMQLVAVPALLFDLTHKAAWLGFSTLAGMVPAVTLQTFDPEPVSAAPATTGA